MLKNRPAAFLCLVFSAGIAAGLFFANLTLAVIAAIGVLVIALLRFKFKLSKKGTAIILTLAALLAGAFYAKVFTFATAPTSPDNNERYTFTAAVCSINRRDAYTYIEAEVQDPLSVFDGERFCMYLRGSDYPKEGTVIAFSGNMRLGNYNNKSKGVSYVANGDYIERTDLTPKGFYFKLLSVRQGIGAVIDNTYDSDTASFYKALLIGDRSGLTAEFNANFSRSGISHIMAISGQHFSLIIFNAYVLLMSLIGRKRICCVISIIFAIAYTLLVGASPSIIRAAFMCCMVFMTFIFNEESDPLINLSLALVILLCFNPYAILNTSLQLSFLATMGIVFIMYHLERYYIAHDTSRILKMLITPVATSVTASLFCTPVFLSRFDYISLIAPLTNILVNWLVGVAMISGIVVIFPAVLLPQLAAIPSLPYRAITAIARWAADMRFACVSVNLPCIGLLALPSLFAISFFSFFRPKKGVRVLVGALLATVIIVVGSFYLQYQSRKENAVFYDNSIESVAHSFYADENITLLIDGNGKSAAYDTVLEQGYTYLDGYVVTACNLDSLIRLRDTMYYTPAHTVYIPDVGNAYSKEMELLALNNGCNVAYFSNGVLKLDPLTIYTPWDEYDEGGYIIKTTKNGSEVCIVGPSSHRIEQAELPKGDVLVFTRSGSANNGGIDPLDSIYDRVIVYENSRIHNYLKANDITDTEYYQDRLLLKLGKSGVVKE